MREIEEYETQNLEECLQALSAYHNEVSTNFSGSYPSRPFKDTLKIFKESLIKRNSRIAVAEEHGRIIGFCKVDIGGGIGKLDYLVVLSEYRGKGYGKAFMEWAMKVFDEHNIRQIEVKVIDGNEAIHLYEKYGFKMNAHILVNKR